MKLMPYTIAIKNAHNVLVSIEQIQLSIGSITFLFGESGIGKSLIAKTIYGAIDPQDLSITINGIPYIEYRTSETVRQLQKFGFFVFQEPSTHLNNLMTISSQLSEGDIAKNEHENQILQYLWQTDDEELIDKICKLYPKPHRPSGGEKQRILLAMAFKKMFSVLPLRESQEKALFIFDEPSGNLDNQFRNIFLKFLFHTFSMYPCTILFITHDYSIINHIMHNHNQLLQSIFFQELYRGSGSQVCCREFHPQVYTNWIHQLKPIHNQYKTKEMLLQVEGTYRVHNQNMCISKSIEWVEPTVLQISEGSIVYVKAPSGTGKTTLAKIIIGLIQPTSIRMKIGNHAITETTSQLLWKRYIWGSYASMVFQHADEALNSEAFVKDIFAGIPGKDQLNISQVKHFLMQIFPDEKIESFLSKKIKYLSGGQKQRLNIFRTLSLDAKLFILDEPLNGLDFLSIQKVLSILNMKLSEGKGFLIISHNEEIFEKFIDPQSIYYLHRLA